MSLKEISYQVDPRGARRTVIFLLVFSLACLLFHLYVPRALTANPDVSGLEKALASGVGVVGFVVFGTLALIYVRRLYSKKPYILLNERGVLDNASGMWSGAGWIEWTEIADIRLSSYHRLPCVELVPKDRERFLQRFGPIERINRSARLGYPAVAIRGPLLPVEPAVLVEQMRTYWRSAST